MKMTMIYLVNYRIGESCSHIGALLFKIEAAVRLGYTATAACTSKPCTWNDDFVNDIAGVKIKDVIFYKAKKKSATSSKGSTGLTNQSQTELLEKLSSLPQKDQPVVLSTFADFAKPFFHKAPIPNIPKLPKSLRELYSPTFKSEDFDRVYQENISAADKDFIERSTRAQANSLAWHTVRVGRMTASVAHSVLHTNEEKPSRSLILKICSLGNKINTPTILWGKENEGKAIQALTMELMKTHQNVNIGRTGLRLHPTFDFIGASSDGVGRCECHGDFLVEIKCPFKHKVKQSIDECLNDDSFCIGDDMHLNPI